MSSGSAVPAPVTAVIEASSGWMPAQLAEVERRLRVNAEGHGAPLAGDAGRTLQAGGKRMRPLLVLICAGPGAGEEAVRAATAVELVHMATLVHDDVLDRAPLRRGLPTVVAASGRRRAVCTGDLLFSRALAELVANGDRRQVEALTDAALALAQGELTQRRDAFDLGVGVERYLHRCRLKTARLFESACILGLLASGEPGGAEELAAYGGGVGLAFQLLDDVLDVTGPPERTGKSRGTDLLDGTVTLPLILAAERDPALARLDLRALDAADAERVCDRIAATGSLEEVRSRALGMIAEAKSAVQRAPLDPDRRRLLSLLADGVVERYG